jgi:hypothetical protein
MTVVQFIGLSSLQRPNGISLPTRYSSASSISSPSLISRVPSASNQVVDVDSGVPEEHTELMRSPTSTFPNVTQTLQYSMPSSVAGSPSTRSIVAA